MNLTIAHLPLNFNFFWGIYSVLVSRRQLTIELTSGKESCTGSASRVSAEDEPSAGRFMDGLAKWLTAGTPQMIYTFSQTE